MTYEPDYKKLCVEASRLYYYGRHDGLASVMRQINEALARDRDLSRGVSNPSEP